MVPSHVCDNINKMHKCYCEFVTSSARFVMCDVMCIRYDIIYDVTFGTSPCMSGSHRTVC